MGIRTFFALFTVAACVCISSAQSPQASPSNTSDAGFSVTATIEAGARALSVNGDHEKYRSDLNYKAGFRLFDSSVLIEKESLGKNTFFNSALIQASGWGSDPSGFLRLNMERTGGFKLDANVRRVRYFNDLKNHVNSWSQVVPTGSEHSMNTLHHFGDIDVVIFPERENFRMRFGTSFSDTEGPGRYTLRFPRSSSDEFEVGSSLDYMSRDLRAGVEGHLLGFNLGLTYGHRWFRDDTKYFDDTFNLGNNPVPNNAILTSALRNFRTRGNTDYANFFFQRTFRGRLDLAGRVTHSVSTSRINQTDILTGRVSTTGNFIVSDSIFVPGQTKRPQTRADLGVTYMATRNFRISNTFTFDQFNISGSNEFLEIDRRTTAAGAPIADAIANTASWRQTPYRRLTNLIEADYQFNNKVGVNVGYRFSKRRVTLLGLDTTLPGGAVTGSEDEEFENTTHSVLAGAKIRPVRNWSIYADIERGESDNVFTRLANNDFFNYRVRTMAAIKSFTLNASLLSKDNDSPGNTAASQIPVTEAIANTKLRMFTGSVDWQPREEFAFSAGYTYTHLTSRVQVALPVGTPALPSTQWRLGESIYYSRDNYFFFDVNVRPVKRVALYASYRINDDIGQGDKIAARPEDIITSYPLRFQTPEVKLAIRLGRNIDWNLGYQYYSYRETAFFNSFAFIVISGQPNRNQLIPAQNYTAHMPYSSLRIYFGRRAGDR